MSQPNSPSTDNSPAEQGLPRPIPANIITGFLGVGKTTAILHLLANKPEHETWGVLVNEFGEIGIDGAMLSGKGAVVREVPGGCMCCVAGLPMQIGLNMLIARSKPDRILIEPTGLGHPAQILKTLTGEYYQQVLDLRASLCLLDPRNLKDRRYLDNDNFRDQVALSDVLVANKTDNCDEDDRQRFDQHCAAQEKGKTFGWVSRGEIDPDWLELPRKHYQAVKADAHHHHNDRVPDAPLVLPEGQDYIRRENRGQGHISCGWLFHESFVFDFNTLFQLFNSINAERLKAVVHTGRGVQAFNAKEGVVSILELEACDHSRIEIINSVPLDWDDIEQSICRAVK